MNFTRVIIALTAMFFVIGCTPEPPKLPQMKTDAGIITDNTKAISEINTILEVYIRPNFPDTYYYVKPITDATGISRSGGEIPMDITTLVREALSQIHYKIRHVEQYDQADFTHYQVEDYLNNSMRFQRKITNFTNYKRPQADFTIAGNISQFDRALQSTSDSKSISGSFGGGQGYSNVSASQGASSRLSRIGVSFNVYTPDGISVPGKFGASMDVHYAKDGFDLGFAIVGVGLGYGTEATSMHGRHLALQMMSEFSVIQIVGRTMGIPYWRACEDKKIFEVDPLVLSGWKEQYYNLCNRNLILPFMQAQCIANGINVNVNGKLDNDTLSSFIKLAQKYNVSSEKLPNLDLYMALEHNRILDTKISSKAWTSYINFRNGVSNIKYSQPQTASPSHNQTPKIRKNDPLKFSSPDYDSALEGLL